VKNYLTMKNLSVLLLVFLLPFVGAYAQTPAFPGADGGGKYTTGGRDGTVYFVTSLEDTNTGNTATREGTLRWCLGRSGAKIIVFKVAGIINLTSQLNIPSNTTIAGQTAPGDGICIAGNAVQINGDNIIIRFIRSRMGDLNNVENDAMWRRRYKNIILDHISLSWCTDECGSFYDNENFTMQWCILAESLRISKHDKGPHGYGGIWGGKKASFHHNLLAHHDSRNPRMCGSRYSNRPDLELVDFRNNVIYNWGSNSGYAGEGGSYNFINNYYKPAGGSANTGRIFAPNPDDGKNSQPAGVWGKFYVAGNVMMNAGGRTVNPAVTGDNWQGIHPANSKNKAELKSDIPFTVPDVTTHTAEKAFEKVLNHSGASFRRDAADTRVTDEALNGLAPVRAFYSVLPLQPQPPSSKNAARTRAGLIDTQDDVDGWDTYSYSPANIPADADRDGIPDEWFAANVPAGHTAGTKNAEGYTWIEVWCNSLVQHIIDEQNEDALPPTGISLPQNDRQAPVVYWSSQENAVCIISANPVRQTSVYSLQGIPVANINASGIYIVRLVLENGESHASKIIVDKCDKLTFRGGQLTDFQITSSKNTDSDFCSYNFLR
jgi:pectate lyase